MIATADVGTVGLFSGADLPPGSWGTRHRCQLSCQAGGVDENPSLGAGRARPVLVALVVLLGNPPALPYDRPFLLRPLQRPAWQVPIENLIRYRADLLPTLEGEHAEPEANIIGEVEFPPLDRCRASGRRSLLLPRFRRLGVAPPSVVNLLNTALPCKLGRIARHRLGRFRRRRALEDPRGQGQAVLLGVRRHGSAPPR